ncbi:MAG TPA: DUF3995 domain-containing protein [Candidatus Eisenbacteria bacterium]|nr:DUF3995 domain-containing protein [Candidatus Eisenbacteria bacterium]
MTRLIGATTAGVLLALAALHVYWAAGGTWGTRVTVPERDGQPLFAPSIAATLVVAALLLAAGGIVLGRLGVVAGTLPRWPFVAGTWVLFFVFAGRAIGDFRWIGFFKAPTPTAFARWDAWLYSPLCALIACGCLVVALRD